MNEFSIKPNPTHLHVKIYGAVHATQSELIHSWYCITLLSPDKDVLPEN